ISLLGEARRWGVDRWFATRKGEQNLAYSLPVFVFVLSLAVGN
ncbi:MAG: hypothetical protein UW13_C0011G0001, partial [candidate division WWE3 bacterium GW2011_GWA1_43_94]